MNRRLQQRLTEPEILKIFGDVCEVILAFSLIVSTFNAHWCSVLGFGVPSLLQSPCAAQRSQGTIEPKKLEVVITYRSFD